MKFTVVALFLGLGLFVQAQEVEFNGATYLVKGKSIFQGETDVTNTLSVEQQIAIKAALNNQEAIAKQAQEAEKQIKKAEKNQRKTEKKLKKAEKELRHKKRAQAYFDKSGERYDDAVKKYNKLKRKGELSPKDEAKWLSKIEDLKKEHQKAERRLRRS